MKALSSRASVLLLVLLTSTSTLASVARAVEDPRTGRSDARLSRSRRVDRDGWIFVHLEGSPEQIGYQHGTLLAKEIGELLSVVKPYLKQSTDRNWAFYRTAAKDMLWSGVDPEYQKEIDGIVDGLSANGVSADRWDVVALNAIMELPYYYVPWLNKKEHQPAKTHAPGNCTAFIATGSWTKDGKIVMGHNNWTNYVWGPRWNVIFDVTPEKGLHFLMDGLPGVIASDDDFGVNASGIMITETTITGFEGWDPNGKPEFSRARKAMQYSTSIDDYVRIMLEGNNGGYANDWLVGDNKTGEIALFELGLEEHSVRRTKDGMFVGANFPVDEKLMKLETKFDPKKKGSSPNARKARWEQLKPQVKGKIDVELAKSFESDVHDAISGKDEASERTLCGVVETSPRGVPEWDWGPYFPGGTVQSKVVDSTLAAEMKLWAKYGHSNGLDFIADDFLAKHPKYRSYKGLIKDMKSGPWSLFAADPKAE